MVISSKMGPNVDPGIPSLIINLDPPNDTHDVGKPHIRHSPKYSFHRRGWRNFFGEGYVPDARMWSVVSSVTLTVDPSLVRVPFCSSYYRDLQVNLL